MEDFPQTLLEFEERFSSEEACRRYLFQLRWPDGFVCPRCGFEASWHTNRDLYRCGSCDYQGSVTAGTIFQDTKKPLRLWFRAMWYITSQRHGVSSLGIQQVLGLGSYRTAWTWLHKLRAAMVRPGRDNLSGTIEIGETYIGGVKQGKRGRGSLGKTLVLVAVEDKNSRLGRIRLRQVLDASAKSLTTAVIECVTPESIIRTDCWKGYGKLSQIGFTHETVRHDIHVGENLLPMVNLVVSLLKRWLVGTHQGAVRPSHLDYYLDEFTFRFNRRTSRSRGKLFYRLAQQAVSVAPLMGKQITGGRHNRNHKI